MNLVQDQTFANTNFDETPLAAEYEACTFTGCNFARVNLSGIRFVDCVFSDCDWSNAKLGNTMLNGVRFTSCKLLGLTFSDCNEFLFTVSFSGCNLSFSSFFRRGLKKTVFKACILHEVDFTEANLSGASFDESDLQRAVFQGAVLEKTDFRTALNFTIDPEANRLKKTRFSRSNLEGLLRKYDLQLD